MWIVELAFAPGDPARLALRGQHRERLTALHGAGRVRSAGPLADDSGAVIVFDVPDRAALDALLAEDPYYAAPGVSVRTVSEWKPFLGG